MNFYKDDNGIWAAAMEVKPVEYPDKGSETCEVLEDNNSFWFNHRNDIICEIIKRYPHTGNFADIGGGNGFQLLSMENSLPGPDYYLIEPGYRACLTARKRGLKNVFNCNFQEFDFAGTNVQGTGLFDVLEHIPDAGAFLNELYASINPNSYVYITVPSYDFLWSDVDDYGKHQKRYNHRSLTELVEKTKFRKEYFSYFFSYLTIPSFLIRTIPYHIFGRRPDEKIIREELKQHRAPALIEKLMGYLNKYEINRLKSGKSLIQGASCILVLKKDQDEYSV